MGLLRSCSRQPAIAVIVAAGLVVAACSSGSSDSNTSTGGTAATSGTSSSAFATTTYAPAQATVTGKSTDVVVNPAVSAAFKHAGIAGEVRPDVEHGDAAVFRSGYGRG